MALPLYAALNELPVYYLLHVMSVTTVIRTHRRTSNISTTNGETATYDSITSDR